MNAVRHRPVAEQYPSSTATVSALASKRISGMEGWSRRFSGHHASTHSATWRASHTAHHAETRAMVVPNIMRPATARVPHSRQRTEWRRAARARCRSDVGSCGLLAGGAQHGPLNVRTQVLTTDNPVGCTLNCRAALGGNGADPVAPLTDENGRYPELFCKARCLTFCRNVGTKIHSPYISAALKGLSSATRIPLVSA